MKNKLKLIGNLALLGLLDIGLIFNISEIFDKHQDPTVLMIGFIISVTIGFIGLITIKDTIDLVKKEL